MRDYKWITDPKKCIMNQILVVLCLIRRNRTSCNLVELIESVSVISTKEPIRMIS